MNKSAYVKLQFKRCLKLCPSVILITVITIFSLVLSFVSVLNSPDVGKLFAPVCIGVVGDVEGTYLGVGVEAIKKTDSSRFYAKLINMTESQAKTAVKNGDITGYIHIPDGFINNITSGKDVSLKYVSAKRGGAIDRLVEQEVVSSVSSIVKECQKNIYSAIDIGKDYGKKDVYKKVHKLNLSYINLILNRNRVYELTLSGVEDDLNYGWYYLCAAIIFFLSIWGIPCSRIIYPGDLSFLRTLRSGGIGAVRQIASSALCFFSLTVCVFCALGFFAGVYFEKVSYDFSAFLGIDAISALVFVIKLSPVFVMFAFLHIFLHEVLNGVGAVLGQFAIAVIMGYVSGFFYPVSFLPKCLGLVSSYLPWGAAFSYVRKLVSGISTTYDLKLIAGYAIMFFVISVVARKHRIAGDKMI